MKKRIFFIISMLLIAKGINAQIKDMLALQVSVNQLELEYRHRLLSDNLWASVYGGAGNQDINSSFDDFVAGVKSGFNLFSKQNSIIAVTAGIGMYFPNNHYYNATTLFADLGARYSLIIGQNKRHCLMISAAYCYGKRDYLQTYSSEIVSTSTVGTFKLSPVRISVGYGFRIN